MPPVSFHADVVIDMFLPHLLQKQPVPVFLVSSESC